MDGDQFTSSARRELFLEKAGTPQGTTVLDVYREAQQRGDTVTEEAYYNLARRLVHRGLLRPVQSQGVTRYRRGVPADKRWLEEEELGALVDPEYPLLALSIWRESQRQTYDIPESVWVEIRQRLRGQSARLLFLDAIVSYCEDFRAQIGDLWRLQATPTPELPDRRQEAENSRRLLLNLTKYGLGLSQEAVDLPLDLSSAINEYAVDKPYVDANVLAEELRQRVADEPFIVDAVIQGPPEKVLLAAVDGSTRGGLLSFVGEDGDLSLGHAPMISINTSVGVVDRLLQLRSRTVPLFIRLPEKPEDMQRTDNRYTVMAKLLFPDMSDAQYMHSVWNAMDVLESRVVLRLLKRWSATPAVEVPPADVVLRDGTVSPQDRDFNHYAEISSYGQIVREMIELNWDIAKHCREDGHTVAGIVKHAQLSVYAPVVNWYACRIAQEKGSQVAAWPMISMNMVPDQVLLTRLLTSGRRKGDPWTRTAIVMRPFHALTNYARVYSRARDVSAPIFKAREAAARDADREKRLFWEQLFRGENDPYVKMIENVFYASFFLGAVPRLDTDKNLPRVEYLVPSFTAPGSDPWPTSNQHRDRLLLALKDNDFDVSAEHSMFRSEATIDVLPRLLIRAHDTVKIWAADLLGRVQEYVGYYLARYVDSKRFRGVKVRPFTPEELRLLYEQLRSERELQAGAPPQPPAIED